MKIRSSFAVKHLASFAILLFLYPIIVFINGLFGHGAVLGVVKSIITISIAFCGYYFGVMIKKRTAPILLSAYFLFTMVAPFLIICLLLKRHIAELIVASILIIAAYIIGFRLSKTSDNEILSEKRYTYITIFYLVGTFAVSIFKINLPIIYTVVFYLIITVIYGLIRNRARIERNMKTRSYAFDYLPKKIMEYNTALLGVSFAFILISTLLIRPLVLLFNSATDSLKSAIANFIIKATLPENSEYTVPIIDNIGSDTFEVFDKTNRNATVINIVTILSIVILAFLFRDAIKAFLFSIKPKRIKIKQEQTDEYSEIEQPLSRIKQNNKTANKSLYKQWKRDYKRYIKMDKGLEKYKLGYSLAIKRLEISGVKIAKSDTTIEIMEKAQQVINNGHYDNATHIYNDIRYGDDSVKANDINDLDKALEFISKIKIN